MGELRGWTRRGPGAVPRPAHGAFPASVKVGAAVALASLAASAVWLTGLDLVLPQAETAVVLALMAGAVAMASAVLAAVTRRLANDVRLVWIGVASALYAAIGIPATSLGAVVSPGQSMLGVARLFTHLVVALMLIVAVWPPRGRSAEPLSLFLLGLLVISASASLAVFAPTAAQAVSSSGPFRALVIVTWCAAGIGLVARGVQIRSAPLRRIGLGVTVTAVAHGYRVVSEPAQPMGQPGLVFSSARLLGVVLVLLGIAQLTKAALRSATDAERELDLALEGELSRSQRVAERDHELRNGLAGLAGVAQVIAAPSGPSAQTDGLFDLVTDELARLDALLDVDPRGVTDESRQPCPIEPLLRNLTMLWRLKGMDIGYRVRGAPVAGVSSTALTQVLTNVVANCARHAAQSPVALRAWEREGSVWVRVTDFGPGIGPAMHRSLFERGTRSVDSQGQGLGLHICRELLRTANGSITIRPSRPDGSGCSVTVVVPAQRPSDGARHIPARGGPTGKPSVSEPSGHGLT